MRFSQRPFILALAIVPLILFSLSCSTGSEKPVVKPPKNPPIKAETPQPQTTPETPMPEAPNSSSRIPEVLRIALVPSIEGGEIVDKTNEFDMALEKILGVKVESKIIPNYVMAIEGLASGQLDCAMLNPLGYVLGKQRFPIEVILKIKRNGSTTYNGQILVNSKLNINSLTDLKGHTFAFVDMVSTSGHLYARSMMVKSGLNIQNDIKNGPVFAGSHDKVALDVMNGTVDAGATFKDVRARLSVKYPEVMEKTKAIAFTEPIPNECFCVTSDLDEQFKMKLRDALIQISRGVQEGNMVTLPLMVMDNIEELIPATDSDYSGVRSVINNLDINLMEYISKQQ